MGVYTFVDKASGFVIGKAVKVGKRDKQTSTDNHFIHITSETITMVHNIYRMYKHKLSNLVSDSHSIYKSKQTKDKCIELDIRQVFSAPGQHQFNGLAEITIQQLHAMVVSMFCLAPYAPKQLWYFAWMHAIDLINMRPSHIPGSNKGRYEEFTGLVPDFNSIILLPWAIPIRFHNAFHKG